MQKLLILILSIFIFGCTSVPISTMFKLSRMNNEKVMAINPADIRVRLTIDKPIELADRSVKLELKFEFKQNVNKQYQFSLESIGQMTEIDSSAWFSQAKRNAYEFKLTRIAQLEFSNYQKELLKNAKIQKYFWTVFYYLQPHQQSKATLDIELKLEHSEDYFFLVKQAEVKIGDR